MSNKIDSIKKNIKQHEAELELLRSIKRNYKKDGSEFSTLGKNFSTKEEYTLRVIKPDFTIQTQGKALDIYGYVNDVFANVRIDITPCVKKDQTTIDESRLIKESCLYPYYIMNPNEIEAAIKEEIEVRELWIKKDLDAINKLNNEEFCSSLREEARNLVKKVAEYADGNLTVKYDLLDILKEELF